MFRNKFFFPAVIILVVIALMGLISASLYFSNLPQNLSQHETILLGQDRFAPGSQAALRVLVRNSRDGAPLEGAEIKVALQPEAGGQAQDLFSGKTGAAGTADVAFKVPDGLEGQPSLIVETRSQLGADKIERQVTIKREYRILLTTDKPIYQPGQVIHVRALALSAFEHAVAAGQPLQVVIADGKGNKVFRKDLTSSEFGAAAVDFQLASEVSSGDYKITAQMGEVSAEKSVRVEYYVLPKFKVALETEKPYYLPGEHVKGTLKANYFYGKAVAGGKVFLEGYTFDVEKLTSLSLEGETDPDGNFDFEFDLPSYITGTDFEQGQGLYYLQANVTDQANHTETANDSLPVAASALVIEAIPEGGKIYSGIETILYVLTSYPDGTPAETELRLVLGGTEMSAHTGKYGLAEVRFTPTSPWVDVNIEARDMQGNYSQTLYSFQDVNAYTTSILLRPDRPVYRVGETMNLSLFTSQAARTAYLDIVRDGQTISTRSVEMQGRQAQLAVDLSPDLAGSLELHAYLVQTDGQIVRDTRLVVVDPANDLQLSMLADKESYLPGDKAALDVNVKDKTGAGVQSALGLAVVDESVFALAEQDPGFARLYFLLEKEILQPRYDLHGYSVPDLLGGLPRPDADLESAVEGAAQASLAALAGSLSGFNLSVNTREQAMQNAYERQNAFFEGLNLALIIIYVLAGLGLVFFCIYGVWKEKLFGRSWGVTIAIAFALLLLFLFMPLGSDYGWAQSPGDRLQAWGMILGETNGLFFVLATLLCGLAGWIILVVLALRRKNGLWGALALLLFVFIASLIGLGMNSQRSGSGIPEALGILALLAAFVVPLAFLLRGVAFLGAKNRLGGVAALLLVWLTLLSVGGVISLSSMHSARGIGGQNDFMMEDGAVMVEEAMAVPAAEPMPMPTMAPAMQEKEAQGEAVSGAAAPRLRQYFPETMLWLPDAVTAEDGSLQVDLPVADSITTWRITALASSQDGRLGSATASLRVFQDFFIDLDLPLALTVGDEISIPVGVFNYLGENQRVRLELEAQEWFELRDNAVKEIDIAANDIGVVYFRVRATDFGKQIFKVSAYGTKMSDAIQKEVRVFPDGKQITFTRSDRLEVDQPITEEIDIPAGAIAGTQKLSVKIYPGVLSQVVEGLDSLLRMPSGCFEQTSSTTYPNVLVLDYLKNTGKVSPEVQMKAEEYINLGYQRLTTFEVDGGGFSLFGNAPADRMLTAYGLQEFSDMSRVYDIDPELLRRAADWLLSQQGPDGSWENDQGLVHESTWSNLGDSKLPVTAYITWSLIDAGYYDNAGTQSGLRYVREFAARAEDPYVMALVANALVAADQKAAGGNALQLSPATKTVLEKLAGMAKQEGNSAYWGSDIATFMGSEGITGSIETTALASLALLRSQDYPELVNAALTFLVRQKDSYGTWYTTQATVLTLKALIESVRSGKENVDVNVTLRLNGGQERKLAVTRENFDVLQMVSFDDINLGAPNRVEISATGEGSLMYQVSGDYYLPWDKLADYPELAGEQAGVKIDLGYDRTTLAVNDTLEVKVKVTLLEEGATAEAAIIDLGLPPGFSVQAEDLAALVKRFADTPPDYAFARIERYELTGRQIILYITNLGAKQPLEFSYHLLAKYPLSAQTPATSAYDYYNPDLSGEVAPQMLIVEE